LFGEECIAELDLTIAAVGNNVQLIDRFACFSILI